MPQRLRNAEHGASPPDADPYPHGVVLLLAILPDVDGLPLFCRWRSGCAYALPMVLHGVLMLIRVILLVPVPALP